MKPNPSSNKTQIVMVSFLLGLGILVLISLVFFALRGNLQQAAVPATQTSPVPTLFIPTPDCGSPTLILGTSTFQIQNLAPAPDGSPVVPSDTSGIAYWLEGTETNPVFVLSPTPENLTVMPTVSIGTTATVTWKNCNSASFNLSAGQAGVLDIAALSDQSTEGITIFFQTDVSGAGFVYKGELTGQQISTIDTPDPTDIQAEISLLETTVSQDGTSIRIGVSIQNYGSSALSLSITDVSLTTQAGEQLVTMNSEPALPTEIAAGTTETIYLTFPSPTTPVATLKILTVEYDLEGY